ncbi:(d)CMP kinase [Bdellovibrionota bacterium FG-1]
MSIPKLGPVIAIDGPAGTGKSSATRRLADLLGFVHIDTGALYRAIAFLTREQLSVRLVDSAGEQQKAAEIARSAHLEFRRMPQKNPANRILANGRDLTDYIRTPEVSMAASRVSAHPEVRAALLGLQRRLGCQGKAILEGRDIGTVIFPDADIKFFLTASVEERAHRRLIELEAAGADAPSFEELKQQMVERDHGDSSRAVAPLKRAPDAVEVDTTAMTLDQVVGLMEAQARARWALGDPK